MQSRVRRTLVKLALQNPLSRWLSRIFDRKIMALLNQDARNIERVLWRRALEDTVDFIEAHLLDAPSFSDRWTLMDYALTQVGPPAHGLYCEFGVWEGSSLNFIALRAKTTVFGFDSFQGLPEKWRDQLDKGAFRVAQLPKVRPNVVLVKGWFDKTIPDFLVRRTELASFLHIDCDLYSSTKTVLTLLCNRIQPGCVIVFDEYFNYPGWREGEFKAFNEFVQSNGIQFEYLGYCRYAQQVAVRITHV